MQSPFRIRHCLISHSAISTTHRPTRSERRTKVEVPLFIESHSPVRVVSGCVLKFG
jgi:hypothetical protein